MHRKWTIAAATVAVAIAIAAALGSRTLASENPAPPQPHSDLPPEASTASRSITWSGHVQPVIDRHCVKCHGPVKQKGGLDLSSFERMQRGGESGPAIVDGDSEVSRLFQNLHPDADPHMPPNKQLPPEDIAAIRDWIDGRHPADPATHGDAAGTVADSESHRGESAGPSLASPEGPPPDLSPNEAIDWFIDRELNRRGLSLSAPCDDRTFARRVHIDLIGRVPTREEIAAFVFSGEFNKRARLVDRLLASSEHARHLREVFDVVLMGRTGEKRDRRRRDNGWHDFLETGFRENRPWDDLVRALILARPESPDERGNVWFQFERDDKHQDIAEALAPIVFGTRIQCAQCHDHPLAHEIKQAHYWAMVAAFNRGYNVETRHGPAVAESAIGGFIKFANLQKETQPARLVFLNGKAVDETIPAQDAKEDDSPERYVVPPPPKDAATEQAAVPKFSRRAALADAVTRENPLLARAFVNRMWALMLGRGLVHPIDEMNSRNPPSHPALLDWLTHDFARSGHDVRRLIRSLALTRTYQAGPADSTAPAPRPPVDSFAARLETPMTGETLFRSMLVATGHPSAETSGIAETSGNRAMTDLRREFLEHFPEVFPETHSATMQQAMFLSNSPLLDALITPTDDNIAARLLLISDIDDRIRAGFMEILGRRPTHAEHQVVRSFLEARADRETAGVKQWIWALLTNAEFLLNH